MYVTGFQWLRIPLHKIPRLQSLSKVMLVHKDLRASVALAGECLSSCVNGMTHFYKNVRVNNVLSESAGLKESVQHLRGTTVFFLPTLF